MVKSFKTNSEYESYVSGGLIAGELYWVEEDKSVHFRTNNIDGTDKVYNIGVGDDLVPEGNIAITENGEDIDVAEYATATVNVPIPAGYIVPTGSKSITANGEAIDVAEYATANVNVPIPQGYILPSGNYAISENGTNIDVAQYATVSVSVSSSPSLVWNTVSDTVSGQGAVDLYLEMNVGDTYVFKSSAGDVIMFLGQNDSEGDGDVDLDDDFYPIGRMVPNKEYYLTATNDYVNAGDDYAYDSGKAYIFFDLNGGSATIQYAVLPNA